MPRGPRLDTPGALHHVVVRGIERSRIFQDDRDREDLLRRLAKLVQEEALAVYAWAFLPNHAHFLVRTGKRPLGRSMRSLLTGYAGAFNRRHRRAGHLFQNRFKSIVVEEEPYFLQLVRYIHLNPLRAGLVRRLRNLDRYPWTGHASLVGTRECAWQDTREVLGRFGRALRSARARYRDFVAGGARQGRRPDLQGGGLVRSAGGWVGVRELRRGRERYAGDERILGRGAFVERVRREVEISGGRVRRGLPLNTLIEKVCAAVGVSWEVLLSGSRQPAACRAREGIAYLWIETWGRSGRQLAPALGVRPQSAHAAAKRGRKGAVAWDRIVASRGS